jgi:maltose alpha-D-glucosyltransferase/alpha-amylase
MVFPGVQKATWTFDKITRSYYHHRFFEHQPDLNTDNPEVRNEILKIMGYWLELGVAGFRVDAVPFILESAAPGKAKPKLRFEYLHEMRRFLQWRKGDAVLLGEANVLPRETKKYFGENGEGIHLMFNFFVNQHLFYALATGDVQPLTKALEATRDIFPGAQWAQFLRNHDELDLGRLTERQRQKVFERMAPERSMQLYDRGIRRRLGPMLGSRQESELAYSLMFSLPGTPVIRYGDEIGMGDDLSLPERDAVRTPMHWNGGPQAGFSQNIKTIHPVISKGPYSYTNVNVEDQRRDPRSMLNWMTSLIRLRKECPEIGWGAWQILTTDVREVLVMRYQGTAGSLVILHNFSELPREVTLSLKQVTSTKLMDLMANDENIAGPSGKHDITLQSFGYRWLRTVE